jgi:uncharacterized membrane protein
MAEQTTKTIIVQGDANEVFRLWADFENFPHFMKHVKAVTKTGDRTSHWVVEGPLGKSIEWDAETTKYEEGKRLAWNSKDHGTEPRGLITSGQVTFNQLPQGQTEVTVTVQYAPPGGKLGEWVAQLFSNPSDRLEDDLRSFKGFAEGRLTRA